MPTLRGGHSPGFTVLPRLRAGAAAAAGGSCLYLHQCTIEGYRQRLADRPPYRRGDRGLLCVYRFVSYLFLQ